VACLTVDTLLDVNVFATALVADLCINTENVAIIAELIRTQIEEAQSLISVDVTDADATETAVTFDDIDEEKNEEVEGAENKEQEQEEEQEHEQEQEQEQEWKEADCRVILNVSCR
jgi:hypothetical protein